ncbi:hypothetical protein [Enterocloster clostridioformis]|uniref:hypothetical protein n=1 Tax=Enterocloster clostridioformis TaxID=1531 RepID=UPI0034A41331
MADLGKIAVTDGGNYSVSTTYEKLTFVHYQGDAYMTLKTVKGVTPTDDGVNYKLFCKSAELATASKAGIVMPDGTTTTVNSSGKMSAKRATQSTPGIVKGSNSIKVGSDGAIDVNTTFTQAVNLANIITGEAIATILGKVSKAIATTMNLNQNALLKSMLTSIDVNDSSKIPTAAYIHTLVERIGMGTQLTAGANLTEAANNLSSNLALKTGAANINTDWATGSANYYAIGKQCVVNALITLKQDTTVNNTLLISGLPSADQEKVCLFHGTTGYGVFKVIAGTGNITIDSGAKGNSIFYFEMIYPTK